MNLKKYERAMTDLEAGRNLPEAIRMIYSTADEDTITRLIAHHTTEARENRRKCEKFRHPTLGPLTHDGDAFVGKHKTPLYPRAVIEVWLETALVENVSVTKLWKQFCRREANLRQELEPVIGRYYEKFRRRARGSELKPLTCNTDVWRTLNKPRIEIFCPRRQVEISIAWTPEWEQEHGLYVYLTPQAKIRHLGEYE